MGDDALEMLRGYLAERDAECPGCGYNLRDLTGTRCPECNQELVLRVGLAEPRMAWFVAGVIGIAMGLGFSSMVLVWGTVMTLTRGGSPPAEELVPLMVGTVVGVVEMWWWAKSRRRLSGASSERRWTWVVVATLVAMISPTWFFALVR